MYSRTENASSDRIDVVDPLTVKLVLKAPSAPLIAAFTDRAGMKVSPKAAQDLGDRFGTRPVCAGPYKFVERVQQQCVGQEVLKGVAPGQQIVKIIHDELLRLLGEGSTGNGAPNGPAATAVTPNQLSPAGERVVNGFHVHAIGWFLTASAFTLRPAEADELTNLWTTLVRIRAEDLRQVNPLLRFVFPRSLPLSPAAWAALVTLVRRMGAQHPERFGSAALRQRRNHWARQVVLGSLLSGLSAILVPTSWLWAATVTPTFLLMGCACVLPTVTLWRAATVVHACHTQGQEAAS